MDGINIVKIILSKSNFILLEHNEPWARQIWSRIWKNQSVITFTEPAEHTLKYRLCTTHSFSVSYLHIFIRCG
jgi:hypothetical protein